MKAHFTNHTKRAGQERKLAAKASTSRSGLSQKRRQKKLPCNRPVKKEIREGSV